VTDEPFDALRQNRHPKTGEALTACDHANHVAFFDIQLSAPKDVSVLAMVGGDDRVREAFVESVKTALAEMERFAAVRERRGEAASTEACRLTGNFVGALFLHDSSRDLDSAAARARGARQRDVGRSAQRVARIAARGDVESVAVSPAGPVSRAGGTAARPRL